MKIQRAFKSTFLIGFIGLILALIVGPLYRSFYYLSPPSPRCCFPAEPINLSSRNIPETYITKYTMDFKWQDSDACSKLGLEGDTSLTLSYRNEIKLLTPSGKEISINLGMAMIDPKHHYILQAAVKEDNQECNADIITSNFLMPVVDFISDLFLRIFELKAGPSANENLPEQNDLNRVPLELLLHNTAYKNNIEACKLLIAEGADVNAKDIFDMTSLHHTAYHGNTNICKLLIDNGANVNAKDAYHYTPLHLAAKGGHIETCKLLIERGADIEVTNYRGISPLHSATNLNNTETCKFFIAIGADVNSTESGHLSSTLGS